MAHFKAVITEKTASSFGESFANTKIPHSKYKGMSRNEFYEAVKYQTCYSFEIVEI